MSQSFDFERLVHLELQETLPEAGRPQTLSALSAAAEISQTPSAESTTTREAPSQKPPSADISATPSRKSSRQPIPATASKGRVVEQPPVGRTANRAEQAA